jgi:hypothetical protein
MATIAPKTVAGLSLLDRPQPCTMNKAAIISLLLVTGSALADTPAFDRPGIAFSTSTVPRGSFAFELGLPDFQHASNSGSRSTLYSLDTNIRAGLTDNVELQLATPIFNYLHTETTGVSNSSSGLGDTSLSLKLALPSSSDNFSWTGLGGVTFATGEGPFTGGKPQYRLASAMGYKLNDKYSAGFYINLIRFDHKTSTTLSPNLSFSLTDTIGAYVEAGFNHVDQNPNTAVAGGGFTWMAAPTVQLDFSMDFGLNRQSPDVVGGFGVSFFIK